MSVDNNTGRRLWGERMDAETAARLAAYKRAWLSYEGQFREPLKVRQGQPNDNVITNYCRVLADKAAMMLFGVEPRFELSEGETTPEEAWLEAFWAANHKMTLLQKIALNGAIFGHVFIKFAVGAPYPRLINIAPEYVTVVSDPEDLDKVLRYVIEWTAADERGDPITIRQTIEQTEAGRWLVRDQVARGVTGNWETRGEETWPWDWAPVIDCQNLPSPNEYYGQPDLTEDVIRLNEAINFVLSNTARIIRFHAHPKTWGKGFRADQLKVAVDEVIALESPDGELHNLEMESDLASSISFYEQLKTALHEISQTPEVAMGKLDNVGTLSGLALRILLGPLVDKTEAKRFPYGEMMTEINRRALEMGGHGAQWITTTIWPELVPGDPQEEGNALLVDKQLGASTDTLLQKRGYDPDKEREKRKMDQQTLGDTLLSAFDRDQDQPE